MALNRGMRSAVQITPKQQYLRFAATAGLWLITADAPVQRRHARAVRCNRSSGAQLILTIAGGLQVPLPGGRTEGVSVFGQYRRITM
ncbi:hypothetical protein D3C78_748900 [compost metagenome]